MSTTASGSRRDTGWARARWRRGLVAAAVAVAVAAGGAGCEVDTPVSTAAAAGPGASWWRPAPGLSWQVQLTTPVDLSVDAAVYDIDGELNGAEVVAALHGRGRKVVCYVDVGAAESYRGDIGQLPRAVLGNAVAGWPQERWLDIRPLGVLRPFLAARFDGCRAKGFDAVDPDLLEAYAADSGFPLTYADQLRFNTFIAQLAHERGLAVGLKGDVDQAKDLVTTFDFTVNEQCAEFAECDTVAAFTRAGKPVFHIEYDVPTSQFCGADRRLGFSSVRKHLALDAWRESC